MEKINYMKMHYHSEWLPLLCSISYTFRKQVFPPSVVEEKKKKQQRNQLLGYMSH